MTGSTRVNAELERKKVDCTIKAIESNIPSSKIGSPEQYKRYTIYILQHLEILFSFYEPGMGETRFRLYQRQQACCRYDVSLFAKPVRYYGTAMSMQQKNMMAISISVWKDKKRPTEFSRKTTS
ncbi:hypothetical protein BDF20DRAFT_912059 [Mycotypha africana]|uniref:uncharacterized protein n=1 Tax=Mycotypha africana TaxID=64632 RepID=UPI002300E2C2|nr:uncharacterized protein BDF20DRAFT_912059 [Mycotypha africana]KAI8981816.1 hypothetical protein BDF20DRAFT_912059 [Mycotypha africana]